MLLEDKEFVFQVMNVFFDRLNKIVTDYSGAQFVMNNRICLHLAEIEKRLFDIDNELSAMNQRKSTEQ